MKKISVVIPAYNEEKMIKEAAETISQLFKNEKIDYEIIFVNDGSKDASWQKISKECSKNSKVRGLCFSRNFGKEAAMFAGLSEAKGDCVAIIDADLQHPPEKLIEMYRLWEEGWEVIEGVKALRGKENILRTFAANAFYGILSKLTKIDIKNASDFKLMDRKVVDALVALPERKVFFRALSFWVGFKQTQVTYEVKERKEGKSRWSTFSLIKYAISNITSFSSLPMQIVTALGVIFFIGALVLGIQSIVRWATGNAASGFTTVILLELIIGAVVMFSVGIVGYYISKIYDEIKGRPRYILTQKINAEEDEERELH